MKKNISYNTFIRNVIILSMFLVVVLFLLYGTYVQSSSIERSIKQDTKVMTDLVFHNLYTIMKSGGNKELIHKTIENIEKEIPHVNIRIIKKDEQNIKPIVQEAFLTKEPQVLQHQQHIDFATPILFKDECLKCHTTSQLHDVAAVTLIEHPILDLKISLKEILMMVTILFVLIILVFFSMWFHFLRKYFVLPIKSLILQIDQSKNHEDLDTKIVIDTNIKEIKHLERVFNKKNKELLKSYISLEKASNTDALTGIYNRKKFDEYSSLVLNNAKRYEYPFALILIDLNKFKPINDTFGHDVGDEVLIYFTKSIISVIRETDHLFRIGGDEFVLLLNNTNAHEANVIVEKIQNFFSENRFYHKDLELDISASFGVAQYHGDGNTVDELLKTADERMYEHKESSRA